MWPLAFKEDKYGKRKCNGQAAQLARIMKRRRKIKPPKGVKITQNQEAFEEFEPNPNFGRFYVAYYEPVLNSAGKPVMNENGFPKTDMVYFKWFDETPYVKVRDAKRRKHAVAVVLW